LCQTGGFDHRQTWRHRQRVAGKSQAIFGVTAADHERRHFVALVPARHAGADLYDFAGDFQAGNFGRAFRWRIVTLPLHHIRPVHTRGGKSHQDFAIARRRHRLLSRHKHVGSARLADRNRGHRFWQTTVRHKHSLSIGERINLFAADVTTGIEAAKNHLCRSHLCRSKTHARRRRG
jgi:hypothetical protein